MTTSAKEDHLRVLWGEINQFIQSSKYPLDYKKGGPLVINHQDIRLWRNGEKCPKSYITGMVANDSSIAAMQGHHIANIGDGVPRTLFLSDESSSVPDDYHRMASTWFNRALIIGNTWPCENFWKRGIEAGTQYSEDGKTCYRRVIKIKAEDSPNVRYAHAQIAAGIEPTNEILVPGVKSYDVYLRNRATMNEVEQCVSLDAEFYKGKGVLLFPNDWLNRAHVIADNLQRNRKGKYIGVDPAEGGDSSCWSVIDSQGLIELVSEKTPNTAIITNQTLALMHKHNIAAENVYFDRGGGGQQHADRLREQGYNVNTVAFGESVNPEIKWPGAVTIYSERVEDSEQKYVYRNRRAEMYGKLSLLLDPVESGFGIPREFKELRRQLAVIPLKYDNEGRLELPPKNKRDPNSKVVTLTELLGCSPDEADSLVLAVYGLCRGDLTKFAGAAF